ncbi:hypothetical protein H1230_06875 [Paenibacillus sp. 19GGS1-52]|uniref:hypothetical protein n=1 Tax=Paenibacillus sp. 19GGS1-52 TaxID=2758563 RepID=UPI001EFAE259|nr:hypothetical protein [Paenibacillus sp. 19GGS1-52]ULO08524.1 hypothetical protein H1230_06875 [Paenibacillus sp. 19GGS1-52]
MIYSEQYRTTIKTNDIEQFLSQSLGLTKVDRLRFSKEICGELIRITGLIANLNGSYAFDTLDGIEEINLIEIDLPVRTNKEIENTILQITNEIAKEYNWIIDLRE